MTAMEVVILTTSSATSEDDIVKITLFPFQYMIFSICAVRFYYDMANLHHIRCMANRTNSRTECNIVLWLIVPH